MFKIFLPMFIIAVISSNLDHYLSIQLESALSNPEGAQKEAYIYGLTSFLSAAFFPVLSLSFCLYALDSSLPKGITLKEYFSKYLNQIFIESLRTWGKIILWSLLFILPGVWKFIEYSLVPFVVTLSKDYDEGKVDALQLSKKIVRKHFPIVSLILVGFHFFIPTILTAIFDSYRLIWKTPIQSVLLSMLDTYILFVSVQLLFNVFKVEVKINEQSHI